MSKYEPLLQFLKRSQRPAPGDPADRIIIIATAREASLVLMTRDKDILTYSRAGYVRTMAC